MNDERTALDARAEDFQKITDFRVTSSPAESISVVRESAAVVAAPGWASIRISGKDAADYLHRRLAQAVKDLEIGCGRQALQLSGEGRMECDLLLYRRDEKDFAALTDASSADSAAEILEKYVIMDEVEVQGEWPEKSSFVLLGPDAPQVLSSLLGESDRVGCEANAWSFVEGSCDGVPVEVYRDGRWAVPCFQIFVPAESFHKIASRFVDETKGMGGSLISPEVFEYARIDQGITLFGWDTTARTLPLEANLRPALDLNKGCFPGQEFLARINNLGHPAHVLARVRFDGRVEVAVGDAVLERVDAPEPGGTITSVQRLEGVEEGVALVTLPWKMREAKAVSLRTKNDSVAASLELLGEYHDARSEGK